MLKIERINRSQPDSSEKQEVKKQGKLFCELCKRVLTSQFHYQKHMRTIHVIKDYICDFDGRHFNSKDKLRLHILQHRKYYRVKCTVCGKSYTTNQSMRKHLRTHIEQHDCGFCGTSFKYKSLLQNHIAAIHEKEPKIQCNFCTRLFPNTATRDVHHRAIHQNQEVDTKHFKCPDCPQGFEMREELRIHSFIHFNGEIHTCLDCHQIFKKKSQLIIHMTKHETANYNCEACGRIFKYKSNLGKHLRAKRCKFLSQENAVLPELEASIAKNQLISMSANPSKVFHFENAKSSVKIEKFNPASRNVDKLKSRKNLKIKIAKRIPRKVRKVKESSYICDLCGFDALYKSHMLSHIRSHISSNRHKCLECSETFRTLMKLQKHSLKAHGHGVIGSIMYSKESFECHVCGQMFSKERMRYHMQHHNEEMFQCDHCPKIFKKKTSLQRHFDCNHSTEKRFTCSTCGKSFAKNRILQQHQMVHVPMKLYIQCEICAKLMQVKSLRIHMETKHGDKYKEKPFMCDCGKSFRYEKQLTKHNESVHVKIDRGINYPCSECDLTFHRRSELREHSFDHYVGKIFQCAECGMKFKKRKLLTIHEFVHKNVSFPCDFCPMTFQTKGGKRKHITKVHSQQITEVFEIPTNFELFQIDEN